MSELAAFFGVPVGGTLPAIRYFAPRPKFLAYMIANYKRKHLYDVGAGSGHVARALTDAGLKVTALDLYHQDFERFPITLADATTYPYEPDSAIMFCRPSHEGSVAKTIATAVKCGVSDILYVGLPANRREDFGDYYRLFRRVLSDAGGKRENVYRMCGEDISKGLWHPRNHGGAYENDNTGARCTEHGSKQT